MLDPSVVGELLDQCAKIGNEVGDKLVIGEVLGQDLPRTWLICWEWDGDGLTERVVSVSLSGTDLPDLISPIRATILAQVYQGVESTPFSAVI